MLDWLARLEDAAGSSKGRDDFAVRAVQETEEDYETWPRNHGPIKAEQGGDYSNMNVGAIKAEEDDMSQPKGAIKAEETNMSWSKSIATIKVEDDSESWNRTVAATEAEDDSKHWHRDPGTIKAEGLPLPDAVAPLGLIAQLALSSAGKNLVDEEDDIWDNNIVSVPGILSKHCGIHNLILGRGGRCLFFV